MSNALKVDKNQEIQQLKEEQFATRRATVPAIEEILYDPIPVLDHGFVRVIDYMGNDSAIVQAARVSYGKGTKMVNEDRGLINYLIRHRHFTPFEMCEIKFHIKAPIFVARQWLRHRTANVNEYSARYSIMDKEFYVPDAKHLAAQSKTNRQGRDEVLQGDQAKRVLELLTEDAMRAYKHYEVMLNEDNEGNILDPSLPGLARELARMNLPVNFYTQWYWKVDLHNLMHFLSLRADAHAQYEIRVFADEIVKVLEKWVPITYEAFMNHRLGAASLSAKGLTVVKALLQGQVIDQVASGMSPREWRELHELLELDPIQGKG
jgi:thymidylate synthase (FAD)